MRYLLFTGTNRNTEKEAKSLAKLIGCSPCTKEVEGSTPTGGTCPNDFSDPIDQDTRTQCTLTWKIVVSEWVSVIAVSLNVALSNRQNCTCARQTLQTQGGRTHGAGCVRLWFRTAEPLEERRYENWNTHTIPKRTSNTFIMRAPFISTCSRNLVRNQGKNF